MMEKTGQIDLKGISTQKLTFGPHRRNTIDKNKQKMKDLTGGSEKFWDRGWETEVKWFSFGT